MTFRLLTTAPQQVISQFPLSLLQGKSGRRFRHEGYVLLLFGNVEFVFPFKREAK